MLQWNAADKAQGNSKETAVDDCKQDTENLNVKYRLACKNCQLDHIHETDSMKTIESFWKNWNKAHGSAMKCEHDYEFHVLN